MPSSAASPERASSAWCSRATTSSRKEELLMDEGKRIRDVRAGPDGALWLLTDDTGEVLRVVPADVN